MFEVYKREEADFRRYTRLWRFENVTEFLVMRQHAACDAETLEAHDRWNRREGITARREQRLPVYKPCPANPGAITLLHASEWDIVERELEHRWGGSVWALYGREI